MMASPCQRERAPPASASTSLLPTMRFSVHEVRLRASRPPREAAAARAAVSPATGRASNFCHNVAAPHALQASPSARRLRHTTRAAMAALMGFEFY